MKKTAALTDNTARRKWDKEEFREKAAEREKNEKSDEEEGESKWEARKRRRLERDPLHQGMIVARSNLQGREYQIDLASRLNKTQVVGFNAPLNQQGGYYCNVCDCVLKDSITYLDHINGKWHNRALGMTMRVEKSTVDQVKRKLEEVKAKKSEPDPDDFLPDGVDRRILEAQEAEEREREAKKQAKKEKKQRERDAQAAAETDGMDPDMMAMMGFGGFGSSK
mmetsp:Transcript_10401/g.31273  ORF Transcript_10401/g.31273 Transcript_10401/m.31273 type:complete len:223 (-) Transcript_10401:145-813(-)